MWCDVDEDGSHWPKQCGFMGPGLGGGVGGGGVGYIVPEFSPVTAPVASNSFSLSIMFPGLASSSLTRPWQCIISHSDRRSLGNMGLNQEMRILRADDRERHPASVQLLILKQVRLLACLQVFSYKNHSRALSFRTRGGNKCREV